MEDLLKPEQKKPKEPKKEPKNPYGQAADLTEEQMITFLDACKQKLAPFYRLLVCIMFVTGGRVQEACFTERENIDLTKGKITVPPGNQKGKPKHDSNGNVINKPYAKTQVYELPSDDGVLTLLRQAASSDGLKDEREDVRKCDKRDYKLPESGYIFRGSAKVVKAKKACEDGDQEALKRATATCAIVPASVDAALGRVKDFLALKDKQHLDSKKDEIDEELNKWVAENPGSTEEGKKQRLAEIEATYRQYDWAKKVTSHTFKRSGCTQLDSKGFTPGQILHYSRHASIDDLSPYIGKTRRSEVRAYPGSVISKALKLPEKRKHDDDEKPEKKVCTSPTSSTTMSNILSEYNDSDSD